MAIWRLGYYSDLFNAEKPNVFSRVYGIDLNLLSRSVHLA